MKLKIISTNYDYKSEYKNIITPLIGKTFSNISDIEDLLNNLFIFIVKDKGFSNITKSFISKINKKFIVNLNKSIRDKCHINNEDIKIESLYLNIKSDIKSKRSFYYRQTKNPELMIKIEIIDKNFEEEILNFEVDTFSSYRWESSYWKYWKKKLYWENYEIQLQSFFHKKELDKDKFNLFKKHTYKFLEKNSSMANKYINFTNNNIQELEKYAIETNYIFNESLFRKSKFAGLMISDILNN